MSPCNNISTGSYLGFQSRLGDGQLLPAHGRVYFFDSLSRTDMALSHPVQVSAGQVLLISAYEMPYDMPIWINRLVQANAAPICGDNCQPGVLENAGGPMAQVVRRERMTLGVGQNGWVFNRSSTKPNCSVLQLIVAVPGWYELEVSDLSMLADGTLIVEGEFWNYNLTQGIPTVYYAGVNEPCDLFTE